MNIGIIGCGGVANRHMNVYRKIEDANVLAVSDIDIKKARIFADNYGIVNVFDDYLDLLEVDDLELTDICTPISTHAQIACDCARSGRHILVEKPMARSSSECDRMINDSDKHDVKLCVCHNQLFIPSIVKAKSMVDSGLYDLICFRTLHKENFEYLKSHGFAPSWNITPQQKGVLWEVGCHQAYLQLHFLGDIKGVYALGGKARYPVHDNFTVLLRASNGDYGIMEISWVSKEAEIVYEISSSDGKRMQIYPYYDYLLERKEDPPMIMKDIVRNVYAEQKRLLSKWTKFGFTYLARGNIFTHFDLIRSYIESLEEDSLPPVKPEDGRKAIELLEAIEKSLNEHREVELP